jgi:hypothetical protein
MFDTRPDAPVPANIIRSVCSALNIDLDAFGASSEDDPH